MASKTLTNVVNDQTIAMNAMIYGYAGHSLVTPQHALQEIWWTDERINQKVTTDFIRTRLKPDERERLDQPIGFGDLTDDTYMDWILERARRLFLCLEEVGMSSKIFRAVENSWDDDDLPLQMEDIYKLSLSSKKSDKINDQFFQTQFTFLLRELREGVHIDYAPNEVLPLEYVMGLPPAVSLQNWPRVHLPKKQNEVYVRRKFPLGNAECPDAFESDFIMDIESSKMVEHEHIAPVWASYTVKGTGYTLTNFVGQHTLKTFIDHRNPLQYQKLPKPERRYLLLGWLHCLADAVATMHQIGFCHSSIRPSNILIDEQNHIAFSDIGSLETFQKDKRPDLTEVYNYTAPELQTTTTQTMTTTIDINPKSPIIPPSGRQPSIMSKSSSSSEKSSRSKKLTKSGSPKPTSDFSGFSFGLRRTKRPKIRQPPRTDGTEKADIFSLGCVMLDVLTFMLKKKAHDFVKHRSTKVDKQKAKETPALAATKSRTDSSFHANHEKVESWMKTLENATFGQEDDAFRAVPHILDLVRAMLQPSPLSRPSAREVRDRLLDILRTFISGMEEVHCAAHTHDIGIASSHSGSGSGGSVSYGSGSSNRASMLSTTSHGSYSSSSSQYSSSSDASTIRYSTASSFRVSSILNSYGDRNSTVLSGIAEEFDVDPHFQRERARDDLAISIGNLSIAETAPHVADRSPATVAPLPTIRTGPMGRERSIPLLEAAAVMRDRPVSGVSTLTVGEEKMLKEAGEKAGEERETTPKTPGTPRIRPWNKPFVLLP